MRDTSPEMEGAARRLRKEMTPAEQRLWEALRKNRQEGFYFRRQHPIDRFVVDFCCTRRMLCVEVDGGIHDEQQERDAERTAQLEAKGYRVLRFRNEEVLNAIHLVVRRIKDALSDPPAAPNPESISLPRHAGGGEPQRAGGGAPAARRPSPRHTEAGPGLLNDIPPPVWRE